MNYKIEVKSEAESKEAQELFVVLGATCCPGLEKNKNVNFLFMNSGFVTACKLQENFDKSRCKEITLPELRDLVVLKLDNRKDANVSEENCLYDLYLTESKDLYFYHCGKNKWILSNLNGDDDYYELLKPIEKPMKEYLNKLTDGTYKLVVLSDVIDGHDGLIEVPEGAEVATLNGKTLYFWKPSENQTFVDGEGWIVCVNIVCTFDEYKENDNNKTVWQRETLNDQVGYRQAEELPFVDDEPSLNDKYAEIEQARKEYKSNHTGSDLPDFLFEDTVNHPSHYASGEIECIDAMEAMLTPEQFIGYLRGNAFKYQWRYENKGGVTDLEKAQWYLNKLISRVG